jgi:transglutaminase-like putative cysteine protease
MISVLVRRLLSWLPDREDSLPLVIFIFEIGLVLAFVFGLDLAVVGFDARPFIVIAFLAVLVPRSFSSSERKPLGKLILLLVSGIGAVLISALRMWNLAGQLVLNFTSMGVYIPDQDRLLRFTDENQIYVQMAERFDVLGNNLRVWMHYLSTGTSIQISQMTQLIWGLLILLSLVWVGWHLHVKLRPFLAVILPIVVLGVASEFTNYPLHYFGVLFAMALFIVVIFSHAEREQSWAASGFGYSLDIRSDLWGFAALVCVAAFLISVFPPKISIRTMLEKMDLIGNEEPSSIDITSGLGLSELYPELRGEGGGGSLPSSHLISRLPEELDTHLFDVWVGNETPVFDSNWRTHTYQIYTGHGWLAGDVYPRSYAEDEIVISNSLSRQVRQSITIWVRSEEAEGKLIHAYQIMSVNQPVDILWRDVGAGQQDYSLGVVDSTLYTVQISRPATRIAQLQASGSDYPEWVSSRYLQLPIDLPVEVSEVAGEITNQFSDPFSKAQSIESYLRQIPYNLDVPVPPADRDLVFYFLFDLRQGYCDYFATAMVVLARSVGLPARVVGGYARGEYLVEEELYKVTAAEAHTWVEVYFSGIGWVEFEPTPARPPVDHQMAVAAEDVIEPEAEEQSDVPKLPGFRQLLLWAGLLLGVPVLSLATWSRIRFQRLSRPVLLLRARDQLYQTAGLMEISSPHCLTPKEILTGIKARIGDRFEGGFTRYLLRNAQSVVLNLVDWVEDTAFRGIPASSINKHHLVKDLVRAARVNQLIRLAEFFQRNQGNSA